MKKSFAFLAVSICCFVLALFFWVCLSFGSDVPLKWDAATGATGYKVYKSEDLGSTWSAPVDVGNVTTYIWVGVIDNKLILFRVSAYNSGGESIRSWSGAWWNGLWKPVTDTGGLSVN